MGMKQLCDPWSPRSSAAATSVDRSAGSDGVRTPLRVDVNAVATAVTHQTTVGSRATMLSPTPL